MEASGKLFSQDAFRRECVRQGLLGSREVVLRVILHVQRFVVIPVGAADEDFFAASFPSHGPLASCPLGDDIQKIVFEIPEDLFQQLSSVLPKCYIIPDCALVARYTLSCSRSGSQLNGEDTSVVYCCDENSFAENRDSSLFIFMARNGKLTFANAIQVHSREDARYFVLATKQKFFSGNHCILCSDWGSLPSLKDVLQPFFVSIEEVALTSSHSEPFMGLFSDILL